MIINALNTEEVEDTADKTACNWESKDGLYCLNFCLFLSHSFKNFFEKYIK